MKTTALFHLMFAASLACFLGTAGAARQDAAPAAIAAQVRALTSAIENGDAAATAVLFTSDAKLSVPGIPGVLEGHDAIRGFWGSALGGGLKRLTLATHDLVGQGDLRVETGSYVAFGADQRELGRGQYLFVWVKQNGTWKISRDYAHPDGAQPGATATSSTDQPDRVGFPRDYPTRFRVLGRTLNDPNHGLTTVYANDLAAAAAAGEHANYPNGSVILMEFAEPQKDGEDQLLRDSRGELLRGPIAHIDVMRRESGYGAAYGANRAGEWEFASYRADGSTRVSAEQGERCAGCHAKAGAGKDYVYRLRSWADH